MAFIVIRIPVKQFIPFTILFYRSSKLIENSDYFLITVNCGHKNWKNVLNLCPLLPRYRVWNNLYIPGQVTMFGLPSILEVLLIGSTIFDAIKFLANEGTGRGIVHGIWIVHNPFSLEQVTRIFRFQLRHHRQPRTNVCTHLLGSICFCVNTWTHH